MKRDWLYPLFFAVFVVAGVQFLDATGVLNQGLFPSPARMWQSFQEDSEVYSKAFLQTWTQTLIGFSMSVFCGIALAILFSYSTFLKKTLLPFAVFFQTVPIIAIAPVLVIYIGYGPETVRACSFLVSVFPVIASTILGLESVESSYVELFRVSRASRLATLFRLKLPAAYASIYSGLKVAAGLSVIGAISGEFVAGYGLGSLIDTARTQMKVEMVFNAILLSTGVAWFLILVLKTAHRILHQFRPYAIDLRD